MVHHQHHQIHIAALDCEAPCNSVYVKRGLFSSQFRVLLQAAAERLNKDVSNQLRHGPIKLHVSGFDAVGRTLPPLDCLRTEPRTSAESTGGPFSPIDAIVVSGSAASAYDQLPWIAELLSFIQTVYTHYPHVKLFGSCFGHQIIAQALLSTPTSDVPATHTFSVQPASTGFEMGIQPIKLDPQFTEYFSPLAKVAAKGPFRIQLVHMDQVLPTPQAQNAAVSAGGPSVSLPAPWLNLGSSAVCPIQGLYYPDRVLTYQGHFEFDTFVNGELMVEFGAHAGWPAEQIAHYVEQVNVARVPGQDEDDDDSKAAAEAVVLFFAGENSEASRASSQEMHGLMTPPLEQPEVFTTS
ncbi:Uncharacterized protein PECH_007687 [Penicillium ucsense]|uniref:Glutamine amidotransferase domain-containing protein n=1 Tax=Penicillium ucsense TaxID=2839758 RepID=A0A8J8W792_9EURO|nr:Uncharacterized protein PECM_003815 [Penicillium ucsense]KAF7734750.1 Uncharacterized protein PECH_007687 [Penicillium ucsense]